MEDIDLRGIAKRFGKSTVDNGYGMFVEMLTYKQAERGHELIKADRWYPSSQLCQCGYKNAL